MRTKTHSEPDLQTAYRGSIGDLVLIVGTAAIVVLAFVSAIR